MQPYNFQYATSLQLMVQKINNIFHDLSSKWTVLNAFSHIHDPNIQLVVYS
jgi:hypothetical protein